MTRAYIALGANLGAPRATMAAAVRRLQADPEIEMVAVSSLYRTAPVGGPAQPAYLNAVVGVETGLVPQALLVRLQALEAAAGRVRAERWGPRLLDLDLLLHGSAIVETAELTLPHPRMHERRFVLVPLADIAPTAIHPVFRRTIAQLLAERSPVPGDIELAARDWLAPEDPPPAAR